MSTREQLQEILTTRYPGGLSHGDMAAISVDLGVTRERIRQLVNAIGFTKLTTKGNFWSFVDVRDPYLCWTWRGSRDVLGYGRLEVRGKRYRAHRYAMLLSGRDIPAGMVIDHLCRTPPCVNPNHLDIVTPAVNAVRGLLGPTRTHCKSGHEYSVDGVYVDKRGFRHCRPCGRARAAEYRTRQLF